MAQVISCERNVNIHKILITCEEGIFEGTIEMRVHDRDNVRAIMENLKKIPDLKEISEIM